jgi:hypothetical protein
MSHTLVQTGPTSLSAVSSNFVTVCLFSLLGLSLSAAFLSNASAETVSIVLSPVG